MVVAAQVVDRRDREEVTANAVASVDSMLGVGVKNARDYVVG